MRTKTIVLGEPDMCSPVLGFGCAAIMGRIGRGASLAALAAAYDAGITFFDTARRAMRRQLAAQSSSGHFSVAALQASLHASLRALGTDYVDLLFLHEAPERCAVERLPCCRLSRKGELQRFHWGKTPMEVEAPVSLTLKMLYKVRLRLERSVAPSAAGETRTVQAKARILTRRGEMTRCMADQMGGGETALGQALGQALGLIAGNGRFPFLVLEAARAQGLRVVVAAIKEETDPEMTQRAEREPEGVRVYWLSLGELSRLIETFQREGVGRAVMAGQVKHKQIFSSIRPDWRLAKLLLNLRTRSTDMLLGAVAKVLEDEGIALMSSTAFLEPMLAPLGTLTRRAPDETERGDIEYGLKVARGVAGFDLGQTVVIAAGACVAVEAMEGTDATIARAGAIFQTLDTEEGERGATTLERRLTVVKVAKPNQDMRFDVPVVGTPTIEAMRSAGATCLCVEAGRTLIFDRERMIAAADAAGIAMVGEGRGMADGG